MPAEGVRLLGRLHVITDNRFDRDPRLVVQVALDAGADVIQVRVKGWTDRCLLALTEEIVGWCAPYGSACIVNDRLDVALAAGAAGVHLGADDLPVGAARRVLGPDFLVGGTARDADTARLLVAAGASYLGVGPCFATRTKSGLPDPIGLAGLASVASAVEVPVIAIGGVRLERVEELRSAGAYGVAVVDAVSGADDPANAVQDLVRAVSAMR
jgi:thiamine-phosphate pyrophosphorylase